MRLDSTRQVADHVQGMRGMVFHVRVEEQSGRRFLFCLVVSFADGKESRSLRLGLCSVVNANIGKYIMQSTDECLRSKHESSWRISMTWVYTMAVASRVTVRDDDLDINRIIVKFPSRR